MIDASNLPQEAYNDLLNKIIILNQRGYSIDPSKSGNLLIDPEKGFNLVDINKSNKSEDHAGYIIVMLMGGNYYFNKISNPETQEAAKKMIKKVEIASKITGLPLNKDSSTQYSYNLAGLN